MNDKKHHVRADGRFATARPTMKDVATRAGVALKTVSRVVNGEPGVTPATATRVLHAIEDLGFRRNESARLLRTGRTSALGFIGDDLADPDTAALCRGIEDVARDHGMLLFTGSTDCDSAREQRLAESLTARRVDGLIIKPSPGDHSYLEAEIEAGTVAVFVLRPPDGIEADTVLADEKGGARTAVAHLIAHGHRRIGLVCGDIGHYRTRQILQGYAEAMSDADLVIEDSWTTLTPQRLPDTPVTAVLCGGRGHTTAVLHALDIAGLSEQMAVVGFGDFGLADYVRPGLTAVSYDAAAIGQIAAEMLFSRIDGETGEDSPARRVDVPMRLVSRGSGEILARRIPAQ
jgi:LacI family transcriptional regulator